MISQKLGGGQWPFGAFPKIHPFWRHHPSLLAQIWNLVFDRLLYCIKNCHVCFSDYVIHERRDLLVVLVVQSRSLHCCGQKNTLFYFLDTHPSVYHSSQQGKCDMNIISSQENAMLYIYI